MILVLDLEEGTIQRGDGGSLEKGAVKLSLWTGLVT